MRGEPWGTPRLVSPVYRRQALALAQLATRAAAARQTFHWLPRDRGRRRAEHGGPQRAGMPADVAAALAAFGHEFDGAIAQQTAAIYAAQPHVYEPAEIAVTKDLAYGPHERQRVDVHTRANRPAEPVPVIVVFHGGGLIGGSRAATVNVAEYFASLGYVGVNGGYRLAPDAKWPEGARDIGAAVDMAARPRRRVRRRSRADLRRRHLDGRPARGDVRFPSRARAATPPGRPGAILVSGPYTFDFAAAGRGELAYFGEDRSRWPEMVVTGQRHERRHSRAHDDGRMGQRALHDVLRASCSTSSSRSTASCRAILQSLGTTTRRSCFRRHGDHSVSSVIVDFIERTGGR